jgi:hypothetical protein
VIVFVEEAAEAIVSADAQPRGIGERFGQRLQGSGVGSAPVRPVVVVVVFVLAQGVAAGVPDSRPLSGRAAVLLT